MNAQTHSSTLRKSKKRTVIKYIFWTVAGLILFVTASISIVIYLIFTPERITPIVMKYANEYINARMECESIELTFYSTFPNFGIRLHNGNIINIADSLPDCPQDTLLKFNSCSVSFNPFALYRKNQLIVNHLRLEQPVIYAYASPAGKTNWDILPQDNSADSSAMKLPDITVHGISVTDADIVYDDRRQDLFVATDSLQIKAKGTLTDVRLSLKVKAVTALYEDKPYASHLPFSLYAHLLSDKSYRHFDLKKSRFSIGIMDFDLEGAVERDTAGNGAKIDVGFNLHSSDLIKAIPGHILNNIGKKYTIPGIFDFSGRINGYLGAGAYPACTVTMKLKDGAIIDNKFPEKSLLQKIEIDCN
ncbi:MAG: AsmA family protein, partial [Prevotellaceae bacterium]|nr:AsmA family protein [Prevotellaceae bacterium]